VIQKRELFEPGTFSPQALFRDRRAADVTPQPFQLPALRPFFSPRVLDAMREFKTPSGPAFPCSPVCDVTIISSMA